MRPVDGSKMRPAGRGEARAQEVAEPPVLAGMMGAMGWPLVKVKTLGL